MKRLLVMTMVCAGWLLGMAQRPAEKLARYSIDFTLSKTDFVDSIAIEWDRGQVFLPVVIGGKDYRFLFDTGSGQAVVYDDLPIPDCQSAGQIISVDAIGHRDTVQMLTLPPITLGSVTFTGCQATLQHRAVRRKNIDGIIGFDIIAKGMNAKIDVQAGLLILSDNRDFFDAEEGYETRYKLNYHVPYIELNPFGRFKEPTLFDTGSRQFYAINKGSFDKGMRGASYMTGVQIKSRTRGRYAFGHQGLEPEGEVVFLTLDAMKWGDFLFSDVNVITTQGGSHLGAALLSHGAVVFNPRRRRVRFEPYSHQNTLSVNNHQPDIAFIAENGRPAVGLVRDGSEPWAQGFRSNDIIIAIDGRSVVSFPQFIAWAFERGRTYRFTVMRSDGSMHEVNWMRLPPAENP